MEKLFYEAGMTAKRYNALVTVRKPFEDAAEKCAKLTIPTIYQTSSFTPGSTIEYPQVSLAADGINTLANKIVLSQYPPNAAFFRYQMKPELQKKYTEQTDDKARTEDEQMLSELEQITMSEVEASKDRPSQLETQKLKLITGNALQYIPEDAPMKVYHLSRYVVKRDPLGRVIEIITKEDIDPRTAPEEIKNIYLAEVRYDDKSTTEPEKKPLYTHVRFVNGSTPVWAVHQEFLGVKVQGSEGSFPEYACPYVPVRATKVDGEDYGRPYVESFIGDLENLELITTFLYTYIKIATKTVFMVNPGSSVREKALTKAKSGEFVRGEVNAVQPLQVNKTADIAFAFQMLQEISRRIQRNLLMTSSIVRDAERVTAVEINALRRELEDGLGGFIMLADQEEQLPYIARKMYVCDKKGLIPSRLREFVDPIIITGVEALGRGHDLNRLAEAAQGLQLLQAFPPELLKRINITEFMNRVFLSANVNPKGLLISEEQLQAETQAQQQQAMQQQVMQSAIPEGVKQLGGLVNNQVQGNLQNG
jgi:hypothetical protein